MLRNKTDWKCCNGYVVDLLKKLSTDVGFTFYLYKVPDNLWGLKQVLHSCKVWCISLLVYTFCKQQKDEETENRNNT